MANKEIADRLRPVMNQEGAANGATHTLRLTAADLADNTTADQSCVVQVTVPGTTPSATAPLHVRLCEARITRAFERVGTGGAPPTANKQIQVGDAGDADRHHGNITVLADQSPPTRIAPEAYLKHKATSAYVIYITFAASGSGKKWSDIDTGILDLFFNISGPTTAVAAA